MTTHQPPPLRFTPVSHDVLTAPLNDIDFLCEDLDLSPGRPPKFVGFGGSGKSWVLQSLLVSCMSDMPLWEKFHIKFGKVAHVDYEMGLNQTLRRYRRLAAGLSVSWEHVSRLLFLADLPNIFLNTQGVYDALCHACDGRVACVIDSLRRALPGEDENSSSITRYVDTLTRASVTTGCTIILSHHSSPKGDATSANTRDDRGFGRGSSALLDACGAEFQLRGKPNEPIQVRQARCGESGNHRPDFELVLQSEWKDSPMYVRYGGEVAARDKNKKSDSDARTAAGEQTKNLLHVIASNPGISESRLRKSGTGMGTDRLSATLTQLVDVGVLVKLPLSGCLGWGYTVV